MNIKRRSFFGMLAGLFAIPSKPLLSVVRFPRLLEWSADTTTGRLTYTAIYEVVTLDDCEATPQFDDPFRHDGEVDEKALCYRKAGPWKRDDGKWVVLRGFATPLTKWPDKFFLLPDGYESFTLPLEKLNG